MYIDLLYLKVEAFSIGVSLKRSKQLLSDRSYRTLLNRAARLSRSETLLQMFTLSRTSLTFGNTSLRIGYSNPPVYRKVGHLESMAKQPSNYHPGNTQNSMFSGVVLIFPIWDRPSHDDTIAIECWWMMGTCQTNWVSGLDGHMIIYICTIWAYILHIYHIYIYICTYYAVYMQYMDDLKIIGIPPDRSVSLQKTGIFSTPLLTVSEIWFGWLLLVEYTGLH